MELDCGIRYGRIAAWLDDELSLPREGGSWTFAAEGALCHITASPLESRSIGHIEIERTLLSAHGDQIAIDAFQRLFTLRFVSAGG